MDQAGGCATWEQQERWDRDPLLRAYVHQVVDRMEAQGLVPAEAQRRLQQNEWWGVLLSAEHHVLSAYAPELVAEELIRPRRCAICGHPLHRSTADLRLPFLKQTRLIHGLLHIAACSCGYSQPLLDDRWVAALLRYVQAHPNDTAIDATHPEFLAVAWPDEG